MDEASLAVDVNPLFVARCCMRKATQHQAKVTARERVIDAALELFQTQGYSATGLNQILAASGAPKGSLYHYFPEGKDQLACAAIEKATGIVIVELSKRVIGVTHVDELVTRMFDYFIDSMESSNFRKGCPIATITLEEAAENERIRSACANAYESWLFMLTQVLGALGIADPARVSNQLLSSIEGALILSRAKKSSSPMADMKNFMLRQTWSDE